MASNSRSPFFLLLAAGPLLDAQSPEVRYTRWNQPELTGGLGDGPGCSSSQNQIVRGRSQ